MNENKSEKIKELVHQANTPLTTCLGYVQMLSKKLENADKIEPAHKDWLKTVESELTRIKDLLKRISSEADN